MKLGNKEKSLRLDTLVDSFAQDFLHIITREKMIAPKHFLMELKLRNMTGQKNVVDIVSELVHSISYYKKCEIESSQAESAKNITNMTLY